MKNVFKGLIVLLCLVCISTFVAADGGGGITVPSADAGWAGGDVNLKNTISKDNGGTGFCPGDSLIPEWYINSVFGGCSFSENGYFGEDIDNDGDECTNAQEYCRYLLIIGDTIPSECNTLNYLERNYITCGCTNGYCENKGGLIEDDYCFDDELDCAEDLGNNPQCNNNKDDDEDDLYDLEDPQCDDSQDVSEFPPHNVPEFSFVGIIVIILATVGVYMYVKKS